MIKRRAYVAKYPFDGDEIILATAEYWSVELGHKFVEAVHANPGILVQGWYVDSNAVECMATT